jgi:LacI family transcriptional regulator
VRPRIKDVAEQAGVSTATVSVVLNNVAGARVATETRERVQAAAEALGYAPNSVARSLRTQRTHTLGLISDRIVTTPYAGRMIQGAQDAAWEAGYVLMLINTGGDQRLESEAIDALVGRQVDGVIYGTMYHQIVDVPDALSGRPVVVLDAEPRSSDITGVVPDELQGGRLAAQHLLAAGHRRIAHVTEVIDVPAARLRLEGFRDVLTEAGVYDERFVVAEESISAGGERAARALLARSDRPSAVFCFNDLLALGALRALHDAGLRVPDDVAVIGFDDVEDGRFSIPSLSTIAPDKAQIAGISVDMLVTRLRRYDPPPLARETTADHQLVARESTG